jgi:cytochrome c biogenesis protein CcmG/thiol:disulfide interchange protein DsbE
MSFLSWRVIPLIVFLCLSFFLWRGLSLDPQQLPSTKINQPVPFFKLPALDDPNDRLSSDDLKGRVVLLNVWASWCATCLDEHDFLMSLAHQGVVIYGLNYKDDLQRARAWLVQNGNPYTAIGADTTGRSAIDFGVYGAPETFLIDSKGMIRYRHTGALNDATWQRVFLPQIRSLTSDVK